MKKILFILVASFTLTFSYGQTEIVKFDRLNNYISGASENKVKVINFWATWCGPCIKELPFIDSIQYDYKPGQVEVMLVSLDFADQVGRVDKFLKRKNINSSVWLLDESDANLFIDKVDPSWTGAIPATLLLNKSTGEKVFLEKELTKEELHQHINELLK